MTKPSTEPTAINPADAWRPQPFAERKSQNLTFGDYFNRALFHVLAGGASGTAIGWSVDKLVKNPLHNVASFKYWGGLIGALVGGYFGWKRVEKSQLEFNDVYNDYRDLPGLRPTNAELVADNALLKRVASHQRERMGDAPVPLVTKDGRARDGLVSTAENLHKIPQRPSL